MKVSFISLGCAKNLVNTEQMMALCAEAGYSIQAQPEGCDVVVVNTCGFLASACEEAIENILEMAELKKAGQVKKILVTGCMTQRYKEDIFHELPEVDGLLGTGSYGDIATAIAEVMEKGEKPCHLGNIHTANQSGERILSTPPWYAYLRIAEGCDNHCAYCVIPSLRGKYRSRPMNELLDEAAELASAGVKELIVIAQDITRYGVDLYHEKKLPELLRELCKLDFHWIRLHYLYPEIIDDELIDLIANEDKIVKYLDIPIQHINNDILRRMNRHCTGDEIRALLQKLRARIPGLVLRTSLITGLPGEGEAEFEELCAWLRENKLERVGAFVFSPEDGTPAAKMEHADEEVAQRRAEIIAELQSRIMDEYDFVKMISQEETQVTDEVFLADYNVYLERIFICDPERTLFTCIMRDVTKARQRRNKIQKTKIHAADLADDIIANQLRIVHEIASLLGETAAETKVAVHDLKEAIMLDEDGDDDA